MSSPRGTTRCCEECHAAIPARLPRLRNQYGRLVCDHCKENTMPLWTASTAEDAEMRSRHAEALASVARVRATATRRVAHDSGDNAVIHHCPFCGSGAVVGTSSGSVSCEFCRNSFTVQVQPTHPFMPQTVDGVPVDGPGMPGDTPTEISAPATRDDVDDAEEEAEDPTLADETEDDEDDTNPVPAQFRTAEGHLLGEADYLTRLALAHAADRTAVLAARTAATGLQRTTVVATEVRPGDRLDANGKTRVARIHPDTSIRVLVQITTTGTRSPSVAQWAPTETVTVWRRA